MPVNREKNKHKTCEYRVNMEVVINNWTTSRNYCRPVKKLLSFQLSSFQEYSVWKAFSTKVETNFKLAEIAIKKFYQNFTNFKCGKRCVFHTCQWDISLHLSIQHPAHAAQFIVMLATWLYFWHFLSFKHNVTWIRSNVELKSISTDWYRLNSTHFSS